MARRQHGKAMSAAFAALASLAMLGGCGSSNDSGMDMPGSTPPPPQRGEVVNGPPALVATYSPDALLGLLGQNDLGKTFLQLAYTPLCTVSVYHMEYETVDPSGALVVAGGALMVPAGSDASCTGGRPMVLYAHGTSTSENYDISHIDSNGEGSLLAAVFAAEGYIVVAPNYLGYDASTLAYHPYLIADAEANDMIDALAAGRASLPTSDAPTSTDGGKLFVTGYSEGGYVAMATHRAMESLGMAVTASAPMSGPYALAAFADAEFEGETNRSAAESLALVMVSYQQDHGDIYATPTDAFAAQYAPTIEGLLPGPTPVSGLQAAGQFPVAAFSDVPPDPAYATYTPATTPANLAPIFAAGFGPDYLVTNEFRAAYLADALAHPDGGFPVLTDGAPPADPQFAFRVHLKENDLRDWVPTAPTLLCGGNSDPEVFFFNTTLMQYFWAAHVPPVAPVILDIDSPVAGGDPYGSLKTGFAAARDLVRANAILAGATDGGDAAVLEAYHAGLVPPFCLAAVKAFFDAH